MLRICIANFISLIKYSEVKPDYVSIIIKPLAAGLACGISAYIAFGILKSFVGISVATATSILVAAAVYLIMVSLLKIIEPEDILSLPMGEKLLFVANKLKIVRK